MSDDLCWAGLSDESGFYRCVLKHGHEGAHEWKKPIEIADGGGPSDLLLDDAVEVDWDGASPINGEPVTYRTTLYGADLAFTATGIYRVRPK